VTAGRFRAHRCYGYHGGGAFDLGQHRELEREGAFRAWTFGVVADGHLVVTRFERQAVAAGLADNEGPGDGAPPADERAQHGPELPQQPAWDLDH
jgi:hypothetical protein